jgi:tape measure domain-containing protein
MSSSIDQRIVEMQFDNAQFEKGISTSLKSLDNLEKGLKLDGASKGLQSVANAANSMNFDGLQSGIYAVQQKFSALEVIGITALQRITNQAISAGEALVNSLSMDQISAGWSKYGAKTKATQTLVAQGNALEDVNKQMEQLNWFTDETSYNFTDMQENIAKFTATGKGLEESVTAMEGIALWAAASGQNATTASRAMYQLSQAMGAGVMRKEDYKSIQNASMDTDEFRQKCLDAGVALGTLKKNADGTYKSLMANSKAFNKSQFAEHLTDDAWLTSDVMMRVYNDYAKAVDQIYTYVQDKADAGEIITTSEAIEAMGDKVDAFGLKVFKAGQEARTFDDAIDSVKDAVSTGWMKTFELIFGDAEQSTKLWTDLANDLYEVFAEGGNERNDYLERLMGKQSDALTEAQWKTVAETTTATDTLKQALMETAKAHGVAIDEMINDETSFEQSLSKGWLTSGILSETLKKFTGDTVESTETLTAKLDEYKKLAADVIQGNYGNGAARKTALAEAGQDYATIQGIVNKMLAGTEITIEDLGDAQLKSIGYTDDQVAALRELAKQAEETGTPLNELIESLNKPSGRDLVVESFSNVLHGLMGAIETVKSAWSEAFPTPTVERVYSILEAINKFTQKLVLTDENSEKLKNTLRGLFDVLGIVTDITSKLADGAFKILSAVMGDVHLNVLDYTESIGKNLTATRKWIRENETLNKIIDTVVDTVIKWVQSIKKWISEHQIVTKIAQTLNTIFTTMVSVVTKAATAVSKWWKSFTGMPAVQTAIEKFKELFFELLEKGKERLDDFGPKVQEFFENFKGFDSLDFSSVSSLFTSFTDAAGSGLGAVIDKLDQLKQNISGFVGSVKEKFAPLQGFIEQFQQLASQGVKKFSFGKILTAATGIAVVASLTKLGDALTAVKKSTEGIKDSLVGVLGSVKGVLTAYQKDIQARSIIKIAAAIAILAVAVGALTFLDQNKLQSSAIALGALGGGLIVLTGALGVLEKKGFLGNTTGAAASMIAMAGSLLLMILAFKQIQDLDVDFSSLAKNLLVMFSLMGTLVAGMWAVNKIGGGSVGSALSLIAYAVAMKLVVKTLSDISVMPLDSIAASLFKMSTIMLTLSAAARVAGKGSMGGAASLIAVVYSLQQMLKMIQTVSDMPLKTMLKGLGMLGGIMLALEWVVTGVGKAGANADKAGKSLLMISAALYIMVEVIRNIDDLNSSALTKGIATIGLMSMFFAVLIAVTKNAGANSVKAGVGILAMSGAVAVLAGAMYVIGKIPASELTKSIAVITSIFTMFGFLMALSSKATGSYKAIIAISASMAALIALMAVMSTMDTDSLTRSTVALDSIMAMLALTIAATKGVDGGSLAAIAMITLAVAAIGFVLYQLASLPNPEDVLPIAVSMSSVLLALSAAMAIMGNMGVVGIATGSLGIIAAIATITAVLEALGGLMKLDIFSENLDNAITAMGKIGEALGTFIGGIGTGLTGQLPKMAKNISDFADGMQEFVEFVHNLDDNFGSKVDTLVKATEKLTRRGFTSGLNNLSASGINYETIGTNLKNLGEAIKGMAAATSGVSVERLTSSAEAVSAIADIMANVPVSGGLWGDIVGNTMNLSDLGSQLTSFAQAMVNYCSIINGAEGGAALDTAAVEQSKAAADILIDLAGKAPNFGDLDLSKLGTQLVTFARAMVRYSQIISGGYGGSAFDSNAVMASENAVNTIIAMSQSIDPTGGFIAWLMGEKDLGAFASNLTAFGEALVSYGQKCTMLSVVSINDTSACIENLVDALNLVGNINFEALNMLSEALNTFTPNSSFVDMFASAAESMSTVGSQMIQAFNTGITENAPSVAENAQTLVNNFVASVTTAISSNTLLIAASIDTLCLTLNTTIANKQADFNTSVTNLLTGVVSTIHEQYNNWYTAGNFLAIVLAAGIRSGESEAINAAAEVAGKALEAAKQKLQINSPSKVMYGFGRYFDLGFANGILDYADTVAKASENIATEAISTAQIIAENIAATMDEDFEYEPTIRPVLDMDEVDSGLNAFDRSFANRSMNLAGSIDRVRKAAPADKYAENVNPSQNQNGGATTYNFNQYNYSPKALSRIDLYRQTNNQFAMMKERGKA